MQDSHTTLHLQSFSRNYGYRKLELWIGDQKSCGQMDPYLHVLYKNVIF